MAHLKQKLKIKCAQSKNNSAKWKLTYKTTNKTSKNNGKLSYTSSKSTNLSYRGQ